MAEDSDNALLPRIGGGGGLPAPVLVNPLAAQNAGIQSAKGLWDIREKQAQEAWGNILQQSTDENGNVDYPKAQLLAKQAGPVVQMGLMSALKDTSGLRGAQITQSGALHSLVGNMAASLMNDPSDANLDKIDAAAAAAGLPATARAEIARIRALPPEQRGAEAYKHVVGNLTALEQLTRGGYQTPVVTQFGGTSAPVTIQSGTPYNPPGMAVGGSVQHTMSPESAGGKVEWVDKTGTKHQGTGAQWAVEHGAGNTVGTPTIITTPAAGGGAPTIPTGQLPGAYQPRGGGTEGVGGAAPPTPPAVVAPATAPATPAAPAVATPAPTHSPAGYTSTAGPTPGTPEAGVAAGTASAGMATELTKRADQVPTNKANYANMLTDLDRLGKMPPGGEREVAINTFLHKLTGTEFGTMTRDQVAAANSFSKLANIAVGQQLAAIGGTDARQQLFMGSNPNLDLSKLGNQQIIHMLQGNEDAIAAKSRAWQDWRKSGKGDDSYGEFQNDFNHHFDPRVFQQQYMGKDEIDTLRKNLTGPGELQKFKEDYAYAKSHGWVR